MATTPLTKSKIAKSKLLQMYRRMALIRRFEEESIKLYRLDKIRGYFHPYIGQEAIAVGSCGAARDDDYIVSTHRGHGHCIAKGADVKLMLAELYGRKTGYCLGRGGSMHIANVAEGNLGANGIVGGGMSLAVGAALGSLLKEDGKVAINFISDGGVSIGIFHEAINLAAIWKLPVVFVIENNFYAVSTPISQSVSIETLARRADAYNIPGTCIDGNDVILVHEEMSKAIDRARSGDGPSIIEMQTYRHTGHHCNDPGKYRDPKVVEAWMGKDPITRLAQHLGAEHGVAEGDLTAIRDEIKQEIKDAIQFAEDSPSPSVDEFLAGIPDYSFEQND